MGNTLEEIKRERLEERIGGLELGRLIQAKIDGARLRALIPRLEELIARNEVANIKEKESLAVPSLVSGVPDEELPPRGSEEAKVLVELEKAIIRRRIDAVLESMDARNALRVGANIRDLDAARQTLEKAKSDLQAVEATEEEEMEYYLAKAKRQAVNSAVIAARKELGDILDEFTA
ncbi:MAG: hypothetical protein M1377_00635 [Deltaproteobacteria bacterium]|nr:hypothetical protein [Deltaproteobacteria bacterium]